MDLSLQQLRGFVAVAEEQHFGRAAQRLNLTQPPLTRQIQGLERTLGVSLFDRTGRGVRLTAAGEVFLEHCRRVLALLEVAPEATRRAADGQTGTLRIAFTAIGAYAVLADFLAMVSKRTPAVTSELTELVSPDQFEALANLEIDIGLVRPPIPEQFDSVLVHSEDLVLAVPADHKLASGDGPVSLADVTDDYIGYSPEGSQYLHDICAAMIGMNRYAVSQLASQVPTMLALVRAGLGCALIPRSIMAMGVQGVRYRELDAADAHSVTLHAAWSPDSPNPALQRLAESLKADPISTLDLELGLARTVLGMSTPQHKIGSGFGHGSTADEVLSGIDLSGKLALVTGGYSGIGLETTRALAKAGAQVVVPARRPGAAQEALAGISNVEVDELDLGDLESVRSFATRFLASGRTIDLQINNAGIMACPETRVGPGWEAQFATNHLGHFALVNQLWPALAAGGGARVVSVSSTGHRGSDIRWDDLEFRQGYDKWQAYGQAKTANILFAVQLDAVGKDSGVRAFALHPGGILTPLQRHLERSEMVGYGWIDEEGNPLNPGFKSPEQGASTQVWAATSPQLDGLGGVFLEDCEIAEVSTDDAPGVRPYAIDPASAARLWTVSAELTGVNAFG